MSEEKSQPEFVDNDQAEEKHDLDKLSDSDSHKNGSNSSQISVLGHHQIHRWQTVSPVLACMVIIAIGIVIGIIIGMTAEFVVQKNKISNLEQQSISRDDELQKRIHNLELQLLYVVEQCKQCNSTAESFSSYDDQELHMKLVTIGTAQNEVQSQLNATQSALSDQRQQIITFRQLTRENFTQIDHKFGGLSEVIANISEQVSHLYLMRNDHSDQLSRISLNLTNISTQVTRFNGSLSNLSSGLDIQKTKIASLTSSVSTLNSHVDEIDRRDTMKNSQLEQRISQLDQRVDSTQYDNTRVSNRLNTVDRRLDSLEEKSGAAAFYPNSMCTAMTIAVILVMTLFAF